MNAQSSFGGSSAFAFADFRFFFLIRLLSDAALHMLAVAVGQYIYETTHDPLMLGYVGLALFVPKFLMTLPAGHLTDTVSRKKLIQLTRILVALTLSGFVWFFVHPNDHDLRWLYVFLFVFGAVNTLDKPSLQAALPDTIPNAILGNAVTWMSASVQFGIILGPALGGILYGFFGGPRTVSLVVLACGFVAALCALQLAFVENAVHNTKENRIKRTLAGLRYVFKHRIILGALSLDLFAVLFGGAVALLPVFANDILNVGAQGLGVLRAAPSVGAALMAFVLAKRASFQNNGKIFFLCVFIFGLGTVCFSLSRNFYLTLFFLMIMGAVDMVSVVIRGMVIQVLVPPEMKGRVSAVSLLFIGASNELGEFESGITAKWFGTVPAAVLGGCLTMLVVAVWAVIFPELRRLKQLEIRTSV